MLDLSRHVSLRLTDLADWDEIERIDFALDFTSGWRFEGAVPSPSDRRRVYASESVFDHRIFVRPGDGAVIGYGAAYSYGRRSASAWIAVAAAPEFMRSGLAMAGFGMFVSALFDTWPLQRLYIETREEHFQTFRSAADHGLITPCGTFADQFRRADHTYGTIYWYLLDRERWMENLSKLLDL